MSALRRLERGGYAFELTPGGSIAFHYAWPDEPPTAWADPLLAPLLPWPPAQYYLPPPHTMLHSN